MKNLLIAIGTDLGLEGSLPTGTVGAAYSTTLRAYGAEVISITLVSEDSTDTWSLVDNGDNTATLSCGTLAHAGRHEFIFRLKDEERRQRLVTRSLTVAS